MLTRLYVRYGSDRFPRGPPCSKNGRPAVLHHPYRGELGRYRTMPSDRRRNEAETLARLTSWNSELIRGRIGADVVPPRQSWRKSLWQ